MPSGKPPLNGNFSLAPFISLFPKRIDAKANPLPPAAPLWASTAAALLAALAGTHWTLRSRPAAWPLVPLVSALIGLLVVTGMRIGEVVRLDRDHVDLDAGILTIVEAKYGKSRQVLL